MNLVHSAENILQKYEKWVRLNPTTMSEIESSVKYLSYIFTSQFENSNLISELIYTLSKLFVFFNDRIIYKFAAETSVPNPYENKLKKWLTIIGHCEVFIELSGQKVWGNYRKWIIIFVVQLFKSVIRLCLLYIDKEQIVEVDPIHPLQRKDVQSLKFNPELQKKKSVSLKNGRVIRTVEAATSIESRRWKALTNESKSAAHDQQLNQYQMTGEVIYILKPLFHLGGIYFFGSRSWKPWLLAFLMDVSSLQLISRTESKKVARFSKRQQAEINRRSLALLMYLMRSPFYDYKTKHYVLYTLNRFSRLPVIGILFQSLNEYLPQWQQTYFHLWSA